MPFGKVATSVGMRALTKEVVKGFNLVGGKKMIQGLDIDVSRSIVAFDLMWDLTPHTPLRPCIRRKAE